MNKEWILTENYDSENPCKCDKCKEVVKCNECAVQYDSLIGGGKIITARGGFVPIEEIDATEQCASKSGRHLFEIENICEGSPSRRQDLNQETVDIMQSL